MGPIRTFTRSAQRSKKMSKISDRRRRGRPTQYTPARLEKRVDEYFKSITRMVRVTEWVRTGRLDKYGHPELEEKKVYNELGEEMEREEFLLPPSVADLADFLNIHRSTWAEYCDHTKHPEFADTTERARGRMHAYYVREVLERKNPRGAQFVLENDFGMREHHEVEIGERAESVMREVSLSERAQMLREIARKIGDNDAEDETDGG